MRRTCLHLPTLGGITVSTGSSGSCQEALGLFTEEAKDLEKFVKNGIGIPDGPMKVLVIKEE